MYSYVEQNHLKDIMLKERLDAFGPVMEEEGIEAWLTMAREYNEDVIFDSMTPAYYPTARRITMLLLTNINGVYERISLSLPDEDLEKYYTRGFDFKSEDQWDALVRILKEKNPKNIAVNYSENFSFGDGLTTGLYMTLLKKLPEELSARLCSAEQLCIRYLETRTPTEEKIYPEVMQVAIDVIEEAFSDKVVKAGKTTLRDVMDFMDSKVNSLGLYCWFPSHVNLQRPGVGVLEEDTVIQKGDMLRTDFGIVYCGLCTDTQRLCYVLKDGETELPEGLKRGMKNNNRFQDIVREVMEIGKTGNEVFLESIAKGKAEGLRPILYTHPLGKHGHAAGPIIGLYTKQEPIPVRGDLKIHNHTSYALELTTMEYVEEFGIDVRMQTEESVVLVDNEVSFLSDTRDRLKVIKGE